MFSILADSLMTATRHEKHKSRPTDDWADRFVPKERRRGELQRYRFNPYRDLW